LSEQAIPAIASVVFLSNRGSTTISCGRDGSQGGNFQVALKKDNIQDRERQNFLHFFYFFISHEQNHRALNSSWRIRCNQKRKGKAQSRHCSGQSRKYLRYFVVTDTMEWKKYCKNTIDSIWRNYGKKC